MPSPPAVPFSSAGFRSLRPRLADWLIPAGLGLLSAGLFLAGETWLAAGKSPSQWFLMAEDESVLTPFRRDTRWQNLRPETPPRVWTDNYSSLFEVFHWC